MGKGTLLAWDTFVRKSKVTTDRRNILSAPHNLCFLSHWFWQIFGSKLYSSNYFFVATIFKKKKKAALNRFIFLSSDRSSLQYIFHPSLVSHIKGVRRRYMSGALIMGCNAKKQIFFATDENFSSFCSSSVTQDCHQGTNCFGTLSQSGRHAFRNAQDTSWANLPEVIIGREDN